MKQNSIMTIAIAILVIVALSLGVTLIFVYNMDEPAPTGTTVPSIPDTPPPTGSSAVPTETPTETTAAPTESETPTSTQTLPTPTTQEPTFPILPDNGLSYISNGDGTCKVGSIGTCTDACVVIPEYAPTGERVVEIAMGAFLDCSTITAVQIPASVTHIGDLAFASCKNLLYISVNPANEHYCDIDGVLYSADRSTLLLYPSMHAGESMTIHADTRVIKEMAFRDCVYLKTVHYKGTPEQWESISIGARNYSLTAAAMTFEETAGK